MARLLIEKGNTLNITTNLTGRVRNTQLAYNRGLMPLFEAVVNSIHAIEEKNEVASNGQVVVEIVREPQLGLLNEDAADRPGPASLPEIAGFKVKDNGIGFTDTHMKSFETLDSDLKAAIGGRGVGRLLWLKTFSRASIDSVYENENGQKARRQFTFTARDGVTSNSPMKVDLPSESWTVVLLEEFHSKYRDASRKTIEAIANSLFEHCLWYFVREGGVPTILIVDGERIIDLDNVYEEHMHSSARKESLTIKDNPFELTHVKLRSTTNRSHFIGWCAANRLVDEENIAGKIPGLHGILGDGDDPFIYACYVTSVYLDDKVRPERTGFSIEEGSSSELLSQIEISKEEMRKEILDRAANCLATHLESSRQAGITRVQEFVATTQPRYRPIIDRIPKEELYVDPKISDKDLDLLLHKHKSESEIHLLSQGHDVMAPRTDESVQDYEARVSDYLRLAEDIKKSDLADYVSHRKVILDLLGVAIKRSEDGTYAREDLIHQLIMPMRQESNSIEFERNNLWLLDERLNFHDYLASDKPLKSMPITNSEEYKRPDIVALNVYDESILLAEEQELPLASIVVVEIKRPMRNDASSGEDRDPIEQTLGYLRRIRAGEMQTASGRQIPNSPNIPGFCYVVCDMTPTMKERCELMGLQITSDHMGYFGFNGALRAYIEVNSFDRLLSGAKERNRAFFERLGLPNN